MSPTLVMVEEMHSGRIRESDLFFSIIQPALKRLAKKLKNQYSGVIHESNVLWSRLSLSNYESW